MTQKYNAEDSPWKDPSVKPPRSDRYWGAWNCGTNQWNFGVYRWDGKEWFYIHSDDGYEEPSVPELWAMIPTLPEVK
jgi:hypothetical protein